MVANGRSAYYLPVMALYLFDVFIPVKGHAPDVSAPDCATFEAPTELAATSEAKRRAGYLVGRLVVLKRPDGTQIWSGPGGRAQRNAWGDSAGL